MTSSFSAAAGGLLITKVASTELPLLGAALLTALYTQTAKTALPSPSAALRAAQSPCAPVVEADFLWREKIPGETSPGTESLSGENYLAEGPDLWRDLARRWSLFRLEESDP